MDFGVARQRDHFVTLAAAEMLLKSDLLKRDLGHVLQKLEELQEARLKAEAAPKKPEPDIPAALLEKAHAFTRAPNLWDLIPEHAALCGIAGERGNVRLGYLGAVSRLLDRPLMIIIQSSSAAGKTTLMDAILAFMPPGAADQILGDDGTIALSGCRTSSFLFLGRRFGLVTCLDVIEHVPDPGALLRGIADVLEPNGHAFLSCPDGSSLCARLLGRQWHHYNCYHYSFFSPQTLSRAADEAGLKIKHVFHPSRARAASYLARYFFEFLLRRSSPVMPQWLDGYSIWINLYDILCATLTMKT